MCICYLTSCCAIAVHPAPPQPPTSLGKVKHDLCAGLDPKGLNALHFKFVFIYFLCLWLLLFELLRVLMNSPLGIHKVILIELN